MKILHLGNLKSGIDTYVRNTVALTDERFDFVVINGADDNNKPYIRNGREVKSYTIEMYRRLNPVKDLQAVVQAVKIIRQEKPDIIHCHSAKGGIIGRIAGFITGCKTVYTAHAFSFLSAETPGKRRVFLLLERMARLRSWLLACSDSERGLGMKEVGYKAEKALAWNNAVPDVTDAIPIAETQGVRYICSIGRPCYQKNPRMMVEVARRVHERHPAVKFYLLGVGFYSPMLEEMKTQIAESGLAHCFVLKPWLSHEETMGYVRQSTVFFMTSLYEGLPISVIEAMALRKPVVATRVIGNIDCVTDGENGFLTSLDPVEMSDRICRLLEDGALLQRMEQASRYIFERDFLINNRIHELETIYQTIHHQ